MPLAVSKSLLTRVVAFADCSLIFIGEYPASLENPVVSLFSTAFASVSLAILEVFNPCPELVGFVVGLWVVVSFPPLLTPIPLLLLVFSVF